MVQKHGISGRFQHKSAHPEPKTRSRPLTGVDTDVPSSGPSEIADPELGLGVHDVHGADGSPIDPGL
jgi:hypothetical protein